jgi:hypothetical protein
LAAKFLITLLKSMEEATSFSTERTARFENLFCDTAEHRYYLISFTLLKKHLHDATETGNIRRI